MNVTGKHMTRSCFFKKRDWYELGGNKFMSYLVQMFSSFRVEIYRLENRFFFYVSPSDEWFNSRAVSFHLYGAVISSVVPLVVFRN